MTEQLVYIAAADNAIKIGVSVDPESRVKDLSVGNPESITLLHSFSVSELDHTARDFESALHDECDRWSKNGEWFEKEAYYHIAGLIKGIGVDVGEYDIGTVE